MKTWTKNGSLQLSIEAIVVLIIAITVLGLGLGFVKNLFGGTFSKLEAISGQLAEEDKKRLLSSTEKVSLLTSEIIVPGREGEFVFAIRNVETGSKTFEIMNAGGTETYIKCYDGIGTIASPRASTVQNWISFSTVPRKEIESQRADIIPVKVTLKANTLPTVYSCSVEVHDDAGIYETKEFTIRYKP